MAKTPNTNLNILIHFLLIFYQIPSYLSQKPTQDSLISCLNDHKLTNYSTQSSSNFHHLHRFSLQNLRANRFPQPYAIILPETKEHLINTVLCCRKSSLEIKIRCGGHSYEGISSMPRGSNPFVIIDMMNLNRVTVEVESETAWVEGGATLGELYTAIAEKGSRYGFPAGVGPTVGVSGHFSGGGIGVMGRKYGLSADNVVDIGLIDAEGRDLGRAEMGEDVFWAVRGGGGGNFGVVYKWKVQLVKVPERVTCFSVTKQSPNNHELAKLMCKWQFIAPKLEDEFYLAIYLTSGANNEVYVTFLGFYLGPKIKAMSVKNREFPELAIEEEEYREMSWIESVLYFSNLPNGSTIQDLKSRYFVGKSCIKTKSDYVREYVSVEGLEGMLDMVALEPNGLVILDPYGGIMDRTESDAIPFPHRKGNLYNILYVAFWKEEDDEDRYLSWVRRFYEYMKPFVTAAPRGAYVNYVDLDLGTMGDVEVGNGVENARNWGEKYFLKNYERLVRAKTIIDPNNVFNHIQGIYPGNVQDHDELYTVWPGIVPSSANDSGFVLREGESSVVAVSTQWSGKVWGRTLCSTNKSTGNFSCQTGDCNTGNIQCASLPSVNPFTLIEFSFGQFNNLDFYDVSVVDGYNLPLSVAPRVDSGCEVTGCVFDLEKSCQLAELRVVSKSNDSLIIGCNSPCDVFSTDQFCCNSPADCQRSNFSLASLIFKRPCPRAYSFALDDATSTYTCDSSRASSYDITFCPSLAMSRLLSIPASQALAPEPAPGPDTSSPIPLTPTTNSTTEPTHQTLPSNTSKRKVHMAMLVAVLIAAGISIFGLFGIYFCISKRKAIKNLNVQTDEMKRFANSLQFDFITIQLATQNFAAENKLGQGGFGEVYKGKLEGGQEVAVKRLSKNSVQGIAEFETEIVLVARLQHKNLVKLLGYCASPNESLLVYEFLPNSSLDKFLFDPAKKSSLDWQTRFNIISGIARGLLYLHEDSRIKVVHRDLKSSNILLDEAMEPKIADFGLARLFEVDQTQGDTKRIVGTYGYMAPEYAITGHYSVKSDVYSFGVIVLEIVSGQRNRSFGRLQLDEALLHRAWRLWNDGEPLNLIDTELGNNFEEEQVIKCIQLGLLCIQENAIDRPRMTFIVAALSGQAIHLPKPKPPHFFGCAVEEDEALDVPNGYVAPHVYTGDETITNVYSRD